MNYIDIKQLVEKYGEDYLAQGDIARIFNIIQDSPSMQAELEHGITEEWLETLKQSGKIFVYTDFRKATSVDDPNKKYPFIECTFQDEREMGHPEKPVKRVPVVRYVCKSQRLISSPSSIAKETEHRMKSKGLYDDKEI